MKNLNSRNEDLRFYSAEKIKIGYIIARVSGWYWGAFQEENFPLNDQKERYTIYQTEQDAIDMLPAALKALNGEHLTIHKIYYV